MELMNLDMKISKEDLKEMEIVRVFAPKRENAQILYCEFKQMSSVYKVYSHTRHMRRGTTISPYIPKEHYSRYRAMEEICYNLRKEEGARTRVKFGRRGLEVWKKQPGVLEYSKVPINSLSELPEVDMLRKKESREDRQLISSPPAGRPGYTPPPAQGKQWKRYRSKSNTQSPESRSPPNKKTYEGDRKKEDTTERENIQGLVKRPDLGKVISIQGSTPTKKSEKLAENMLDTTSSPIYRKGSNTVQ